VARQVPGGAPWQYLRVTEDAQQCGRHPDSEYVELAVEVFSLLADATRVRIVLALREIEELSVNHLADIVDRPPATVSQHLAKMRMARMVTTRHHGNRVFYKLVDEHASRLVVDAIHQAEHALGGVPRHHLASHPPRTSTVPAP
jgi:DNA-binding transcriptional ArsR family regulator